MKEWFESIVPGDIINFLIVSAVIILISFMCIKIISGIFKRRFSSMPSFAYRAAKCVIITLAIFGILVQIEPLKAFALSVFAGSGVVAIILGLAAQEAIGNMICGFVILFNKPVDIGDFVTIESTDVEGEISDISLRHTVIKGLDGKIFVVPNSTMNKQVIRSLNRKGKLICSYLYVSVAYTADVDRALQIMAEEVNKHPASKDYRTAAQVAEGKPRTSTRVDELGSTDIRLKAMLWTTSKAVSLSTLSELRISVLKRFKEEGIEIPYPYLNVILNK